MRTTMLIKRIFILVLFALSGGLLVVAQSTSGSVLPLKQYKPGEALSKTLSKKILQQQSCQSISSLGGSIRKENYLVGINKSLSSISNEADYAEWYTIGRPFPRGDLIRKVSLGLSVRGEGDLNKKRITTARVIEVTGKPKIKSPIKIPLRQTAIESCESLSNIDSFVKEGVVMAENEPIKIKVYDLEDKELPPEDFELLPGQEMFLKNSKICAYEGQAYFSRYDYFDEFDFWKNSRKAFSRQKTKKGTVIKFFDGSSLLVDDREDWFSEIGLARLESWQEVEENEILLSAAQIKLEKGDSLTLLFSNGLKRELSTEGVFCYQIDQLPLLDLIEDKKDKEIKDDEEKKKDPNEFEAAVNNVNTCRPPTFPPYDKSNMAILDRIRVNMCKTFSKDISTRQNSVHINQTPQVPDNLQNRGQNEDKSCPVPPSPPSKLPRNSSKGTRNNTKKYEEKIDKVIYGYDKAYSKIADAGNSSAYGDTSYTQALRSLTNFKTEKFNRDIKNMNRAQEAQSLQRRMERNGQGQEESFKANKATTCQTTQFRKHMEDIAGKPKVKS